jgi:general secretion pathway protein G
MICKIQGQSLDRRPRRAAFTLMEMLVVVAIIVVLAGVGGAYLIGQLNESKVNTAQIKARNISNAIEMFYVDNSMYPQTLDQLLVQDPTTKKGPYLKSIDDIMSPIDGRPFNYDPTGQIGLQKGNVVATPDVYITLNDGRVIGNFKSK